MLADKDEEMPLLYYREMFFPNCTTASHSSLIREEQVKDVTLKDDPGVWGGEEQLRSSAQDGG